MGSGSYKETASGNVSLQFLTGAVLQHTKAITINFPKLLIQLLYWFSVIVSFPYHMRDQCHMIFRFFQNILHQCHIIIPYDSRLTLSLIIHDHGTHIDTYCISRFKCRGQLSAYGLQRKSRIRQLGYLLYACMLQCIGCDTFSCNNMGIAFQICNNVRSLQQFRLNRTT